jgi:type VI secretion system protein
MPQLSFLDKFSTGRVAGERHGLASVMRNVQAMLSTKKDYGYFLRDFGLGGYTEKRSKAGMAGELAKEMEAELRQHEPRLEDVEVELRGRDNALWLHYELSARLNGDPCRMRILFDTTTGQVRVEPQEGG